MLRDLGKGNHERECRARPDQNKHNGGDQAGGTRNIKQFRPFDRFENQHFKNDGINDGDSGDLGRADPAQIDAAHNQNREHDRRTGIDHGLTPFSPGHARDGRDVVLFGVIHAVGREHDQDQDPRADTRQEKLTDGDFADNTKHDHAN